MTRTEIDAIINLIEAKIDLYKARNSSDGGLSESLREMQCERDLRELATDND